MKSGAILNRLARDYGIPNEEIVDLIHNLRDDWGLPDLTEPDTLAAPAEYMVPVPEGYDTVVGYLAKRGSSAMFGTPSEIAERTVRDGYWLSWRCGNDFYTVPAPGPLQALGIDRLKAYPVHLLERRSEIQRSRAAQAV